MLRNIFSKLLIVAAISIAPVVAHAQGIPVYDNLSFVNAVKQITAWGQQAQQMESEITQAKAQYAAVTGARGLGDILNSSALSNIVPTDVTNVYNELNQGGFNGLTAAASTIRNSQAIYNCSNQSGVDQTRCQAWLSNNAQRTADSEGALSLLKDRYTQIQSLRDSINSTTDPKAIAELQARIAAEQAAVGNESTQIAVQKQIADEQQQATLQAVQEDQLKNLSNTSDGSDTFTFKMH